jgi:hypothetical protein
VNGISDSVALRFGAGGEHDFAENVAVLGAFVGHYPAYATSANDEYSF